MAFDRVERGPDDFSGIDLAARIFNGIGYRFYRAMIGIRPEHLGFRPTDGAFTLQEQIDHIAQLLETIRALLEVRPPVYGAATQQTVFDHLAAIVQLVTTKSIEDLRGIRTGNGRTFLTLINGPAEDAIAHIGQINLYKRMIGIAPSGGGYMDAAPVADDSGDAQE